MTICTLCTLVYSIAIVQPATPIFKLELAFALMYAPMAAMQTSPKTSANSASMHAKSARILAHAHLAKQQLTGILTEPTAYLTPPTLMTELTPFSLSSAARSSLTATFAAIHQSVSSVSRATTTIQGPTNVLTAILPSPTAPSAPVRSSAVPAMWGLRLVVIYLVYQPHAWIPTAIPVPLLQAYVFNAILALENGLTQTALSAACLVLLQTAQCAIS